MPTERDDVDAMSPLSRLARFHLLASRKINRNEAEHGLAPGELDVLAALWRNGDPYGTTHSGLAATLAMSIHGVTVRLDGLQATGLVERRVDPADRRWGFALTEEGLRVVEAAMADHTAIENRLLSALDETELAELDRLLGTLLTSVQD